MTKFNSRYEILRMIRRYVAGTANKEEIQFLETYYEYFEHEDDVFQGMSKPEIEKLEEELYQVLSFEQDYETSGLVRPLWFSWKRLVAAASILIFCTIGLYLYKSHSINQQSRIVAKPKPVIKDIAPGGNMAVLTLADGTKINLDQATNGKIADQAGLDITKQGGQLVYSPKSSKSANSSSQNLFNVIETPRGGEYKIVLPDGTQVWLNAASNLRYPAIFTGNERMVELKGEAYFEVVSNKKMPFRVKSNLQVVEVLGTHFNVNSYADEVTVRTTLIEGSVKILRENSKTTQTLQPGEQSSVNPDIPFVRVNSVNTEEFIAWKNGYFLFNNENIESIMRKIARWYNVDIEYKGEKPVGEFGGAVSKSKNISEVLRILQRTKAVNFKVQGRRVTVMN
ncbi:MAG TPA: FecR family protein [Daejeonella sp.]|uniref:FecR family protein n=1 Tax=Daejeonella sp. TaxID=2805397 RepID=UPI002ED82845